MQPITLALVLACVAWSVAIWDQARTRRADRYRLDYWWAVAVFATGGIGSMASFTFVSLTPDQVTLVRTIAIIAIGLAIMVTAAFRKALVLSPIGLLLSPYLAILILPLLSGQQVLMPILSLLMFAPVIFRPRERYSFLSLVHGAKTGITITLITLSALSLTMNSNIIGPCRFDKCSIWGQSLGTEGTGNALGMILAVSATVTLMSARNLWASISIALSSLILVDMTSSRSAIYGLYVGLGVVLAYKLTAWTRNRTWVLLALAGTASAVVWLPLQRWSGDEFTGRATLWRYALQLMEQSPVIGYGSSFWVSGTGSDGISRNYSTHNYFTESLITSGILGTALLVLAILVACFGKQFPSSTFATGVFAAILGASLTEVVSAPGRTYLFAGALVFAFMVSQSGAASDNPPAVAGLGLKNARELERLSH